MYKNLASGDCQRLKGTHFFSVVEHSDTAFSDLIMTHIFSVFVPVQDSNFVGILLFKMAYWVTNCGDFWEGFCIKSFWPNSSPVCFKEVRQLGLSRENLTRTSN